VWIFVAFKPQAWMSVVGYKQTSSHPKSTSALPP
jgi:hypothetical protein